MIFPELSDVISEKFIDSGWNNITIIKEKYAMRPIFRAKRPKNFNFASWELMTNWFIISFKIFLKIDAWKLKIFLFYQPPPPPPPPPPPEEPPPPEPEEEGEEEIVLDIEEDRLEIELEKSAALKAAPDMEVYQTGA